MEVVHFLLKTGRCNPLALDEQNRSIVFRAANACQPRLLKYLLLQVHLRARVLTLEFFMI